MPPKKSAGSRPEGEEGPSFEASLERLEVIVQELEAGTLTLEESLARYEEGVRLSKQLTQTLDRAEQRIERLNEEGAPTETHPIEPNDSRSPRSGSGEGELPF